MYAGRMGYGAHLPTSLGEGNVYNLAGVSEAGYGPYLGDFFDDLSKAAEQVGAISKELQQVAQGERKVATFPPDQATVVVPVGGKPVALAIPLVPLVAGAAFLAYLALRR